MSPGWWSPDISNIVDLAAPAIRMEIQAQVQTIFDKTCHVRQLLGNLVSSIDNVARNDGVPPLASASIVDASERFTLWAGNLGAMRHPSARISLDYRLSDGPEVQGLIHRQLDEMKDAIETCEATLHYDTFCSPCQACSDLVPWIVSSVTAGTHPTRGSKSSPELDDILDEELLAEIGNDLVFWEEDSPNEDATVACGLLSACITALFRIGILVRKSSPRDRFMRALQAQGDAFPPFFDIDYVRQKHPKVRNELLLARFGGAIAKRRQFIKYCRDHKTRLGADDGALEALATATERASSKATTFFPSTIPLQSQGALVVGADEDLEDDNVSIMTASTTTDSLSTLKLHSLQDLAPEGQPFECPICFTLQSFRNERAWR